MCHGMKLSILGCVRLVRGAGLFPVQVLQLSHAGERQRQERAWLRHWCRRRHACASGLPVRVQAAAATSCAVLFINVTFVTEPCSACLEAATMLGGARASFLLTFAKQLVKFC